MRQQCSNWSYAKRHRNLINLPISNQTRNRCSFSRDIYSGEPSALQISHITNQKTGDKFLPCLLCFYFAAECATDGACHCVIPLYIFPPLFFSYTKKNQSSLLSCLCLYAQCVVRVFCFFFVYTFVVLQWERRSLFLLRVMSV